MSDFPIEAAAAELGCEVRWLKDNCKHFEHQEYGNKKTFTAAQLDKIREARRVVPPQEQPLVETPAPVTGRIPVTQLRPSQRRRRASI